MKNKEILTPSILTFLRSFVVTSMNFFFAIFLVNKGFSGLEIGILFAASHISSLIFSFNSGLASDRHSIRNVSFISFLLMGIFYYLMPSANIFLPVLLLFVIGGFAYKLCDISLTAYVLKLTKDKSRGTNIGTYGLSKWLGTAAGFLIGGYLILQLDFNLTLKTIGIFSLLIGFASFFLQKNQTFRFPIIDYTKDFLHKHVIIYATILFFYTLHWGAELTSYSLFLRNNLALNTFQSGIYMSIPVMFLAIVAYLTGKKHDNGLRFKHIVYFGLFLSGLGHILMTVNQLHFSFIMRVIHEIGDGIFLFYLFAAIHKHFPKKRLGGSTGFVFSITTLGTIVGSLIFGPIGQYFGYNWPLSISGGIMLLLLIFSKFYEKYI